MNPEQALRQLTEIRERLARSQDFRGFTPLAVACSGLLAFAGAAIQPRLVPAPTRDLGSYLLLWIFVAALGASAAGWGVWCRTNRRGTELGRAKTIQALEQVAPCLVVGAIVTFFVYRDAPEVGWLLPGLWSLTFGLGAFASRSMLSPAVFWVGVYYVAAGTVCLSLGQGHEALAPWQMALCFGGGQFLGAAVLQWTVESSDAAR